MSDIKAGDLVMITKPQPCCGSIRVIGQIFTVGEVHQRTTRCPECGGEYVNILQAKDFADGLSCAVSRPVKIDPPAEGDSLPTCADQSRQGEHHERQRCFET